MNFKEMHERAQSAPVGFSPEETPEEKQEGAKASFSDVYPFEG